MGWCVYDDEFETIKIRWAHLIVHPVVRQVRDVGERIASYNWGGTAVSNRPHTDFSVWGFLYLKGTQWDCSSKGQREKKIINRIEDIEKRTQSWQKQKAISGQFGGSFVPEPIQNLLNQLEETFEQYKKWPRIYRRIQNIIWKTILDGKHHSTFAESLTEHLGGAKFIWSAKTWIT